MPGRMRIACETPLPDRAALQALANGLAAFAGVKQVEIRPQTGSLIIRHLHGVDPAAAAVGAGLIVLLPDPPAEPTDPIHEVTQHLTAADAAVSRLTDGRLDLWGAGFTALVLAGLVQLARGQVVGPAFTLFGQAATLVMAKPLRMFVR